MEILSVTLFILLGCFIILLAWFAFSKQKLEKRYQEISNKLMSVESSYLSLKQSAGHLKTEKKPMAKMRENHINSTAHQSEIFELKKEMAHLKDELKKTKTDLRGKEKELKESENNTKNKLYNLTEDNAKLLEQLKALDISLKETTESNRNKVSLSEFEEKQKEIQFLKTEVSKYKNRAQDSEKQQRQAAQKIDSLQEKLKVLDKDMKKWNEVALALGGKTLSPETFFMWRERALTARKMYQQMKHMREMSDDKVQTYQDGILELSQWVLEQKGLPTPTVHDMENKTDRFFAQAWDAVRT